jgi:hypothetical protein
LLERSASGDHNFDSKCRDMHTRSVACWGLENKLFVPKGASRGVWHQAGNGEELGFVL